MDLNTGLLGPEATALHHEFEEQLNGLSRLGAEEDLVLSAWMASQLVLRISESPAPGADALKQLTQLSVLCQQGIAVLSLGPNGKTP